MKHDDEFMPESVEEQIDQLAYSLHQEPLSPSAQVIQQLHEYYEADTRSAERMWERLAPHVAKHTSTMQPVADKPRLSNEAHKERFQAMKSGILFAGWEGPSRLASVAAVLFVVLLVGSLLAVLQTAHFSHTGSQPNSGSQSNSHGSSHALYISKKGEVTKLDPQTRKSIWQTSIPLKSSSLDAGALVIIDDTVYLDDLADHFYALDARDGHIRWSHEGLNVGLPKMVDGLLYVEKGSLITGSQVLYALDPADGKIKATYKAPAKGGYSPIVANGILYYATDTNLYAVRLSDQKQVWSKKLASTQQLESLQVKNGLVYAQVMVMHPPTGTHGLIMAFDARTGEKRWESSAMPTGVRFSAITDTTLYSASIGSLDAFDAHTGKQLWHQNIDTFNIQVNSDTLYIGYMTAPMEGSTGIAALRAGDGTFLWRANLAWQEADSPLGLQDGVLYTTSNNGKNGAIDAFKTSDGSRLWHMPLSGDATQWHVVFA